ncbi:MAG: NADH-quinone oxidoreductase subunit L [Candidatus Micrarchaeota archaeon]|nr:NADH-quinone oxidoreductase subunit L [Candidatus Micrarchaeota archaeon]
MLALFVVLPFVLSGVLAMLVKSDRLAGPIALAAGLVSIGLVGWLYLNNPGMQALTWFTAGAYPITLVTSLSQLHIWFLALIAFMSTMVILYSMGFMDVPSERHAYFSEISFFAAGMMLFAIGADLITLFVGWELIGFASYLLIGFWRHRESAVNAARKAVIVLLIGDLLMFSGIALLWVQLHSLSLAYIEANASGYLASAAALFIVAGALTKSAQFPFHEWLTDAMEGPTPVSALLHSSTMVKAGVFLAMVLLPFLIKAGMGPILIGAGLISVIVAVVNALSSTHIKRILAYSTIEDMGLMFIALGFGSLLAAFLLFLFQTLYKGLAFMNAGELTKANNDEMDIRKLVGSTRLAIIVPVIIGVASLAGVFPLGGFFGKAAVDSAVSNYVVYAVLMLVEVVSSMYIFRWLLVPLSNRARSGKSLYNEPRSMVMAVYIVSIGVVASSLVWPYLSGSSRWPPISLLDGATYTLMLLVGFALSYALYYKRIVAARKMRSILSQLSDISIPINTFYGFVVWVASKCGSAVDEFEYYLYSIVKVCGHGFVNISLLFERTQDGSINYYLVMFIVGAIAAVVIFSVI